MPLKRGSLFEFRTTRFRLSDRNRSKSEANTGYGNGKLSRYCNE